MVARNWRSPRDRRDELDLDRKAGLHSERIGERRTTRVEPRDHGARQHDTFAHDHAGQHVHLRQGLNVALGQVSYEAVANTLAYDFVPAQALLA